MNPRQWIVTAAAAVVAAAAAGSTAECLHRRERARFVKATAFLVARSIDAARQPAAAAVRRLARELGGGALPSRAPLERALRLTSRDRPELTRLMVADPEGRILAVYLPDRPPGRGGVPLSGLDEADRRRKRLLQTGLPVQIPVTEAGTVTRIELAAPVFDTRGEISAYVAATCSLDPLRAQLKNLEHTARITLTLTDRDGNRVYPLQGRSRPGSRGIPVSGGFTYHLAAGSTPAPWVALAVFAVVLLLFGAVSVAKRWTRRRETPREPEQSDDPKAVAGDDGNASN